MYFLKYLCFLLFCSALTFDNANAGLIAVGLCYAGCAAIVVPCFTAAGAVFGVAKLAAINASPGLKACNYAFSCCEAACTAAKAIWCRIADMQLCDCVKHII